MLPPTVVITEEDRNIARLAGRSLWACLEQEKKVLERESAHISLSDSACYELSVRKGGKR